MPQVGPNVRQRREQQLLLHRELLRQRDLQAGYVWYWRRSLPGREYLLSRIYLLRWSRLPEDMPGRRRVLPVLRRHLRSLPVL